MDPVLLPAVLNIIAPGQPRNALGDRAALLTGTARAGAGLPGRVR